MVAKKTSVRSRMERKKLEMKIISVSLKLMVTQGVEATAMEQIEQADIAKGTLYSYFPVKEAILDSR